MTTAQPIGPLSPARDGSPAAPRRKRRYRRLLAWAGVLFLLALVAAELFARFYLHLGDPPLYMADKEIEYLMVPSRTYHRFNAVSHYNRWSMRCDDFQEKKS